ncbi:MAG: Dps family protein [Cytophagales bacterium]
MQPNIGISEKNTQEVANILSKLLADEFVLCTKTRNAHWNVEGIDFYDKHKFFEGQFEQLDEAIDSIAERIRTVGHYVSGSLTKFLETTHLTEQTREQNDGKGFISLLLADHESIIISIRENITPVTEKHKDLGTSDFLTSIMEMHEKMAWFLRAHLK